MGVAGSLTLATLVSFSYLADKSAPYSIFDFYGYTHPHLVTFGITGSQTSPTTCGGTITASENLNTNVSFLITYTTDLDGDQLTFATMLSGTNSIPWSGSTTNGAMYLQVVISSVTPTSSGDQRYE